jgi:glycosyltransferase involved in cell wall biosynthesis
MVIAFVHNNKAFLPEIEAYVNFFSAYNIQCEVVNKDEIGLVHRNVEWRLMGSDLSKPKEGIYKIHEYCSSSTPPWIKWKNWSKSFMNTQPDFRLFLNPYVKKSFSLHDRIPFGYRDMGLPKEWVESSPPKEEKAFDFIYIGNLSASREPGRLLDCFAKGHLRERTLLLVSSNYESLRIRYQEYKNIIFIGPVPHPAIYDIMLKARYAINFIADQEPLNRQTSTKLLEYASVGLPIISTRYQWVEEFQQQYFGNYFYLHPDLSNFTWENVVSFEYSLPDLKEWTWEKQIRKCGVLRFLERKFPDLKFDD